jgi:hypothetical protein
MGFRAKLLILKLCSWVKLDWFVGTKVFGWTLDSHYGGSWGKHFHTKKGHVVYCGRGATGTFRRDY